MSDYILPTAIKNIGRDIVCKESDPSKINIALMTLRALGVPIYQGSEKFDRDYPRIGWDQSCIILYSATCYEKNKKWVDTVEEFVAMFLNIKSEITISKITNDYDATITSDDKIKVGCQTVNIAAFKELVSKAQEKGII